MVSTRSTRASRTLPTPPTTGARRPLAELSTNVAIAAGDGSPLPKRQRRSKAAANADANADADNAEAADADAKVGESADAAVTTPGLRRSTRVKTPRVPLAVASYGESDAEDDDVSSAQDEDVYMGAEDADDDDNVEVEEGEGDDDNVKVKGEPLKASAEDAGDDDSDFEVEEEPPEISAEEAYRKGDFDALLAIAEEEEEEAKEDADDDGDFLDGEVDEADETAEVVARADVDYTPQLGVDPFAPDFVCPADAAERLERFRGRIREIFTALIALAVAIPLKGMQGSALKSQPLTFYWWAYLIRRRKDMEQYLDLFFKAVPERVQLVIGQLEFSFADLLGLQTECWPSAWGVYLSILTKSTEKRIYVGSATSKQSKKNPAWGLDGRLTHYQKVSNGRRPLEIHHEELISEGWRPHLFPLAVFSMDITRAEVNCLETIFMILLGTLDIQPGGYYTDRCPQTVVDGVRGDILTSWRPRGVNHTWSVIQSCRTETPTDKNCHICRNDRSCRWTRRFDPNTLAVGFECWTCVCYRQKHGEPRPRKYWVPQMRMRAGQYFCDACGRRPVLGYRFYFDEQGDRLLCRNEGNRDSHPKGRETCYTQLILGLLPYNASGACVTCGLPGSTKLASRDGLLRCCACRAKFQRATARPSNRAEVMTQLRFRSYMETGSPPSVEDGFRHCATCGGWALSEPCFQDDRYRCHAHKMWINSSWSDDLSQGRKDEIIRRLSAFELELEQQ